MAAYAGSANALGIAVLVVSGSTDSEHRNRCARIGVQCLCKPWDDATLAHLVARVEADAARLDAALRVAVDELAVMHALTPFETRLARIIAQGIGPGAFARELGVATRQMNEIRRSLFDKCGWPGVARPNASLLRERLLERAFAILMERRAFNEAPPPSA